MTSGPLFFLAHERQRLIHERMLLERQWGSRAPDRVRARIDDLSHQIRGIDRDLDSLVPGATAYRLEVQP